MVIEEAPLRSDQEIKKYRGNRCSANWRHDWFHNVLLGFIEMPFFDSERRDRRCKFKNSHRFSSLLWL